MDTIRELGRVSVNLRITEIENGYVVETIKVDTHLGPKFFATPGAVTDYCHASMRVWEQKEIAAGKE